MKGWYLQSPALCLAHSWHSVSEEEELGEAGTRYGEHRTWWVQGWREAPGVTALGQGQLPSPRCHPQTALRLQTHTRASGVERKCPIEEPTNILP